MVGADVGQLRQFGQALASGAERIELAAATTTRALARTKWVGPDANEFRQRWNASLKGQLGNAASRLRAASALVTGEADEQERTSDGGGTIGVGADGGGGGGGGGTPPTGCTPLPPIAQPVSALAEWAPYAGISVGIGAAGTYATHLLNQMVKGGLLTAQYGQMAGALTATGDVIPAYQVGRTVQVLNASRLAGTAFAGLGVATGLVQAYQGFACGDGYAGADGVVTAVLAGASLIPPLTIAAGIASVAWGALQLWSGDVPVTKRIGDGVSAAWNWLTGG